MGFVLLFGVDWLFMMRWSVMLLVLFVVVWVELVVLRVVC